MVHDCFFICCYVDGESGIQANDISCALTVAQREPEVPQSSCATGIGSNQVLTEASFEQRQRNVPYGNAVRLDAIRGTHPYHIDMLRESEDYAQSTDFQGENQPILLEAKSHGEGTCLCSMLYLQISKCSGHPAEF